MHHALIVAVRHPIRDLADDGERLLCRHRRAFVDQDAERLTLDQLGHEIGHSIKAARTQSAQDRRMFKRLHHLQLALKPLVLRWVADDALVGHLERNLAPIDHVKGAINIAHAALRQVRLNLIMIELIPDLQHVGRYYSTSVHRWLTLRSVR